MENGDNGLTFHHVIERVATELRQDRERASSRGLLEARTALDQLWKPSSATPMSVQWMPYLPLGVHGLIVLSPVREVTRHVTGNVNGRQWYMEKNVMETYLKARNATNSCVRLMVCGPNGSRGEHVVRLVTLDISIAIETVPLTMWPLMVSPALVKQTRVLGAELLFAKLMDNGQCGRHGARAQFPVVKET